VARSLRGAVVAFCAVFVVAIPVARGGVAFGAGGTEGASWSLSAQSSNVRGRCFVRLTAALHVSPLAPTVGLAATVGPDCSVHSQQIQPDPQRARTKGPGLAAPLADSFRGCRSRNTMWDTFGLADLTRLTTALEFNYSGTLVTYISGWSGAPLNVTYTAPGSPYRANAPFLWSGRTAVPDTEVNTDYAADFFWFGAADHTKENFAHGFGDGNCNTQFSHSGFVCQTCQVRFYLDYY